VEGLLSVLLGRTTRIRSLLESGSNKKSEVDKFNRVYILAEDDSLSMLIFYKNITFCKYFNLVAKFGIFS